MQDNTDIVKKLNSYKGNFEHKGELHYVDVEFSKEDVLISLMSIDTHLRSLSAYGSDVAEAINNFDKKIVEAGIVIS